MLENVKRKVKQMTKGGKKKKFDLEENVLVFS